VSLVSLACLVSLASLVYISDQKKAFYKQKKLTQKLSQGGKKVPGGVSTLSIFIMCHNEMGGRAPF